MNVYIPHILNHLNKYSVYKIVGKMYYKEPDQNVTTFFSYYHHWANIVTMVDFSEQDQSS